MGLLDLGFSSSKTSSETEEEKTLRERGLESITGSETQTGIQTGSTAGTTSQTGTQAGSSTTLGTASTTGSRDTVSALESLGGAFSQDTGATLEKFLLSRLDSSSDLSGLALDKQGAFDADQFISSVVNRASGVIAGDVGTANRVAASAIGGTEATNSQAALLSSKQRESGAEALAGIEAQATAQAQNIGSQQIRDLLGIQTAEDQGLTSLISAIKGGQTFGTQATTGTEATQSTQETESAQLFEQLSTQLGLSTEDTMQTILKLIESEGTKATSRDVDTTATRSTTGKESGINVGISDFKI